MSTSSDDKSDLNMLTVLFQSFVPIHFVTGAEIDTAKINHCKPGYGHTLLR